MRTVIVGGRFTNCAVEGWEGIEPGRDGGKCIFFPDSFAREIAALLRPVHYRNDFIPLRTDVKSFVDLLRRKEGKVGYFARWLSGTTRRSPGPVYCDSGRMRRLLASCSSMCAVQPVMRAMTKNGVNMSVSKPIMW